MKRWATTLLLLFGLMIQPVLADETEGTEASDETTTQATVEEKDEVKSPILRLAELDIDEYVVPARAINLPLPGRIKTVQEILDQLDKWSEDDQIGAILLNINFVRLSMPDVQELRDGILRLKAKDKKVMAYLHAGGANAYLLASTADEIAMAPSAYLVIPGLGTLFPFLKGHFQMRGIEFDVITAGRYKYPGFVSRREPNKWFTEEITAIFDSWYDDYRDMIVKSRGLSLDDVTKSVDVALFSATQAQQRGLVDVLAYEDEYRDRLLTRNKMKRYDGHERSLADVNSIQDFIALLNEELKKADEARKAVGPKIAVLHARGPIIDFKLGSAFSSVVISRDTFVEVIDDLRKNKSIKAVVMRVDSPGGSGYASDTIWKELRRLDEVKPLVVSMGSVAGSGGYYIACPARRIYAQPTTITGSIGVLSVFQSAWSLFNRMDYELMELKRGERSLLGAPHRNIDPPDRVFFQKFMDDFYDVFIDRVAQTRKMPADQVRKIAEGRIWSGRDALEIGLVDELGGLADAIEAARNMANIPPSAEIKIVHYPRPSSLGEFFESFSMVSVDQAIQTMSQANTAARPMTFTEQLNLFSQRFEPLCWMATPEFWGPDFASQIGLPQPAQSPATLNPLNRLFNTWQALEQHEPALR